MRASRAAQALRGGEDLTRRTWNALPRSLTGRAEVQVVRRTVLTRLRGETPPPAPRAVRTLDELDDVLSELEHAVTVSDDELRRGFRSFFMPPDVLRLPPDPFSSAYREAVMAFYEQLHGTPHGTSNEVTRLDVDAATRRPFPFFTGSSQTAGDHLMAVGHLLSTLKVTSGTRVLELGAGWGNATVALAQLGCEVTAIDISADFTELIRRRGDQAGVQIDARTGDFSSVSELVERFDVVVFFESFHHSADHQQLLRDLHGIVAPGGRVVFGSEPINRTYRVPWGPRLDGESLWAIRRNGWLELGFRPAYFREVLARCGWDARRVPCSFGHGASTYVASEA